MSRAFLQIMDTLENLAETGVTLFTHGTVYELVLDTIEDASLIANDGVKVTFKLKPKAVSVK